MPILDRRSFLTGAVALSAAPALGQVPRTGEVDVVIVGAGAAGIAAARRVAAGGRRFALIEARDRVGGRCITDVQTFGVPFDRGAHWIHAPETNPVLRLAREGFQIDQAVRALRLRIGRRNAREGEAEDFLVAQVRSRRAIREASRGANDIACARALPNDLRDWRETVEFVLGPYGCGKDLADVSAKDFARLDEREADAVCRQGYGALLAKLAEGIPVTRAAPVKRIDWSRGIGVETDKGRFSARAAIVTVSTNVLAGGAIAFEPHLPKPVLDACAKLALGSHDLIALELPGNPLGLQQDELIFEMAAGRDTAALLGNASGTNLCMVQVGGTFGRDLAARGEAAMTAFALDWLTRLYGGDLRRSVKRTAATDWNKAPYVRGAFSVAAPGGQPARRTLVQPVGGRIWFAGEAAHETLWGTVGGAWESGERAAAAVLKQLETPAQQPRPERRKPRSDRRTPRAEAPPKRQPRRQAPPPSRTGPDSIPYPLRN
jgi:monoamine oxidase